MCVSADHVSVVESAVNLIHCFANSRHMRKSLPKKEFATGSVKERKKAESIYSKSKQRRIWWFGRLLPATWTVGSPSTLFLFHEFKLFGWSVIFDDGMHLEQTIRALVALVLMHPFHSSHSVQFELWRTGNWFDGNLSNERKNQWEKMQYFALEISPESLSGVQILRSLASIRGQFVDGHS